MVITLSITSNAQVRPDIFSYSSTQRTQLANLIIDFVDSNILQMHCDYVNYMGVGSYDIHDDYNFLPFHRTYIERLEDWLISKGYPQFVPLPKWTGLVAPPIEFSTAGPGGDGVSPFCGTTTCGNASGTCGTPTNWSATVSMPNYLKLPIVSGSSNDLCDWSFTPATYTTNNDNSGFNGLSRKIETPWHNSGHGALGGVMGNFKSPAAAIFWLWHAAVDDKWKEWEQNCSQSNTHPVDLYMKDNQFVVEYYRDRGEEPNIDNGPMWVSKDIWVRNQADGVLNQTHQNPEYGQVNYVYVRVRNRGYQMSLGTEQLKLYWAKANTALTWPNHWNGSMTVGSGISLGQPIGVMNVPSIGGQDQTILQFPWYPPNPNDYVGLINNIHHFCLLARIVAPNDPMANEVNGSVYANTKNNNNIVWKNLSVVDLQAIANPKPTGEFAGANIFIGNVLKKRAQNYDIRFQLPRHYRGNAILDEAEVTVVLDRKTWRKWTESTQGRRTTESLRVKNLDKKQLIIENDGAVLKNLRFEPNEQTLIRVNFNFLARRMSGQKEFDFDVIQTVAGTDEIIGGERFHIIVDGRNGFFANAGNDVVISKGDIANLNAYRLPEKAIYNWYDQEGNLIYSGSNLTVSPNITKKYRLEVISNLNGIKDYDTVVVKVKSFEISTVYPNPAKSRVTLNYKATKANSAYIMITQSYGTTRNYIIDKNKQSIDIDLSKYQPGVYHVVLVCNGKIVDSKPLIVK